MTSDDEFDTLSIPDIGDDQWDKLEASLVRGSRLPPPSSEPGGNIFIKASTEGVEQGGGNEQPIIETQSTFSDGYSFFEPTESQQALLDQILASQSPVQVPSGSCHFLIESSNIDIEEAFNMPHPHKSLMQLFRPAGTLSVTDLVHPIWWALCLPVVLWHRIFWSQYLIYHRRCQLKTEYDLRGLKHHGERHRKEIFVTAHNKQIAINREVSKKAAEMTRKGRVRILPNRRDAGS